jgi:predicted dehydrogenase
LGEPLRHIRRRGAGASPVADAASRIPAGHPEGYLEGFANLYADVAEQIAARIEGREPDPLALQVPDVEQGLRGVRFIEASVRSSGRKGAWTQV